LLLVDNKEETKKSDAESTSAAAVLVPHLTLAVCLRHNGQTVVKQVDWAELSKTGLYSHPI